MSKTIKVVLIRHGESTWNSENRFTGWTDVPLSEKGQKEALIAGQKLKQDGWKFDVAYTSVLSRAIKTLWIVMEEMDLMWIPVHRDYRLNERMYGALQGLDKIETANKHGEAQVKIWRRSYDVPPPPLDIKDPRYPGNDPRFSTTCPPDKMPLTEALKDTVSRCVPFWTEKIVPELKAGKRVLISAHGNSIRALIKYLDNVSETDIVDLNIPNGIPLVYEFDVETLKPVKHYYLSDEETVKAAIQSVANQTKKQ